MNLCTYVMLNKTKKKQTASDDGGRKRDNPTAGHVGNDKKRREHPTKALVLPQPALFVMEIVAQLLFDIL